MCKCHAAFLVINLDGLAVASVCTAGCAVSCVCYGHCGIRKGIKYVFAENFADKAHIFVGCENAVIVYNDTAAFLTSVLKCKQTVI